MIEMTAREIATQIAEGQLTAVEAVEAFIERIEEVNPEINAVCFKRYKEAREEARAVDAREPIGPLHGVPITVKECLDLVGTPSTSGIPSRASHRATQDDRYVARLREAGAIVLGKTNVSQFLAYNESDNPLYGRTNNPCNVERSCGGSSGGQAAIIAADGSPLGIGTDIGGSVRVPAHSCGIAGIKPTTGLMPDLGRLSIPIGQQAIPSQVGVLGRTVDDVALGLEVCGDTKTAPVDLSTLKVAYYTELDDFPAAASVQRGVLEAVEILRESGATLIPWQPPGIESVVRLFFSIIVGDGGQRAAELIKRGERDPHIQDMIRLSGFSRLRRAILKQLLTSTGQHRQADFLGYIGHTDTYHYWTCVEELLDYQQTFAQALDADLILCPVAPLPAYTHGASRALGTAGSYAILYNLLGYPGGIVPITTVQPDDIPPPRPIRDHVPRTAQEVEQNSIGLPIGVQVVARPWQEHLVLAAMQAIETGQKKPGA